MQRQQSVVVCRLVGQRGGGTVASVFPVELTLPEPVGEHPSTSRPLSTSGMHALCTGVGTTMSMPEQASTSHCAMPSSLKLFASSASLSPLLLLLLSSLSLASLSSDPLSELLVALSPCAATSSSSSCSSAPAPPPAPFAAAVTRCRLRARRAVFDEEDFAVAAAPAPLSPPTLAS